MRATLNRINKWIKAKYPDLDIELVKGDGYFYFDGDDGFDNVDSIYVPNLNHAPYKWWSERVVDLIDDRRIPEPSEPAESGSVLKLRRR